ncbi:MAG: single-stranded DNA-binding protein [Hyphomicrobiales bacterium]|nr:MAG: single-stranded DNA-binding protein [Hyphomicrobiales bacterium]
MLNQCQFIGHLGADPESRRSQDGKLIVTLSLAVSEKWKSRDGERKEKTEWIRCVIFSEGLCKIAEQYLSKGSKIFLSGKFTTRKWQDQSGADRYSTEIVMSGFDAKLVMLDTRSDGDRQGSQSDQSGGSVGHQDPNDLNEEIPF